MNKSSTLVQPVKIAAGIDVLCTRRGGSEFWIPCARVRGLLQLKEVTPLPCAKRWVVGLAVHEERPLPVIDLSVQVGPVQPRYKVAVLLADETQDIIAMILTDGPGRLAKVPASVQAGPANEHLVRITNSAFPCWWLDTDLLATALKG